MRKFISMSWSECKQLVQIGVTSKQQHPIHQPALCPWFVNVKARFASWLL